MKLFEIKNDLVTVNLDTRVIKEFASKPNKTKIDYGDPNQLLIDKVKNGNQDAIIKTIGIIKKILVESGCTSYEELYRKIKSK